MEAAVQTCHFHPDRRAGVRCQRCDRPICPDCMRQASVGFHCPACTKAHAQPVVRPRRAGAPVVTRLLLVANLAVYVAGLGPGLRTKDTFVGAGGLVGLGRLVDGVPVALSTPFGELVGVAEGEWWRMLTSGFLHGSLLHVGFNCLLLYQLGHLVEPALGSVRFALAYVATLLTGAFGVLLLEPNAFTIGASGAVFGLMGLTITMLRARGINAFDTGLGGLVLINLVITFTVPGISIGGHLGGLIGGFVVGYVLAGTGPRALRDPRTSATVVAAVALAALAGGIAVA